MGKGGGGGGGDNGAAARAEARAQQALQELNQFKAQSAAELEKKTKELGQAHKKELEEIDKENKAKVAQKQAEADQNFAEAEKQKKLAEEAEMKAQEQKELKKKALESRIDNLKRTVDECCEKTLTQLDITHDAYNNWAASLKPSAVTAESNQHVTRENLQQQQTKNKQSLISALNMTGEMVKSLRESMTLLIQSKSFTAQGAI
jgi:hypothetical protein